MQQENFLFTLNERPPIHKNLIYGLQWVIIAIPNVVVFSALCGTALGLDPAAQISFSQRLLIATGLMTLLQSLKGHKYPLLEGPSSALLLSFTVLAPYGLSTIEGGMIFGGFFLISVYKLKLFKRLSTFFTPNVVGIILMLVALSLLPFVYPLLIGMDKAHPNGALSIAGSSLLIIFFVSLFSYWLRGFFQTTSMLAGIFLGLILFLMKGEISLAVVRESSWFALPSPIWGGWPSFSVAPILAMVFTYLAVMINTVGSIQGISEIVGKERLEDRIHRGIGMTGAGGFVAAFLGVVGLVSFSISPGVVLVTRVASRFSLTMAGAIMIGSAFIPKLWAILNAIPPSVTAAVLFVVLSIQLMAGLTVIMSGKGKIERREYFTVGLPLLLGTTVSMIPKPFFQLLPGAIASLVSNGLVVGILFALLFEHVIFKPRTQGAYPSGRR
ncbi:MAG: solute carrier family 23 protein [Thermodesulfobacteriota bacterium]|nr:solute carrier family 23 protein [Thermodesulfobacteriota bacterium]